jgi:hypothetical protein
MTRQHSLQSLAKVFEQVKPISVEGTGGSNYQQQWPRAGPSASGNSILSSLWTYFATLEEHFPTEILQGSAYVYLIKGATRPGYDAWRQTISALSS